MDILIDLDETIVNLLDPWLATYNEEYNDVLTREHLTGWNTHEFVRPECGLKIYDIVARPGFFRHLQPYPGAVEAVQRLLFAKHNVVIVSAGADGHTAAQDKINWCRDYLGLGRQNVIIGHKKHMIKADVLIDDSPNNIATYRKAWPEAAILTIAHPYNASVHNLCDRFVGWRDPAGAWQKIVGAIETLERAR